jgi:hypothetical protein
MTVSAKMSSEELLDRWEAVANKYDRLFYAVKDLYYAAVWHADRPVDEQLLWTTVRDLAGFEPGKSPKELPFDGIRVSYDVDRLRQIGHLVSAKKGREFGTTETRALLLLYGSELTDRLNETVRKFLEEKLS